MKPGRCHLLPVPHWYVTVRSPRLVHFLRKPRLTTTNPHRAHRSIFTWRPVPHTGRYALSLLGIAHALTGVVVQMGEPRVR